MKKQTPPGFMIFQEFSETLKILDDSSRGKMILAMIQYFESGIAPEFESEALKVLWPIAKNSLDSQAEKYVETCQGRSYAVFVREYRKQLRKQGIAEESEILARTPSYEEWLEHASNDII